MSTNFYKGSLLLGLLLLLLPAVCNTSYVLAQQDPLIVISGKVRIRGQNGKESVAPGVSILEKGTRNGTVTNADGKFALKVRKNTVLLISMVGYKAIEVKVDPASPGLDLILEEDVSGLNEVVVTGFQQIDKTKFSGAATKLKAEDIKMDGIADVSRMLEGRAAGVSVQNVSGTFGSAPKLRIRGATSLTGPNKPLWVVDGIVLEDVIDVTNDQLSSGDPSTLLASAVAGLNMNDIESFYVLKDAAATSLYGARAMNGVVVINTKKGRSGKLLVNYSGTFSSQLRPGYRNFNIMNSAEQMSVYSEIHRKGLLNLADVGNMADKGVFGKMYDQLQEVDGATGGFMLENTPEARRTFLERYAKANTNWFNVLFRNSIIQEHSISLTGGTEKMQSYVSTSFYNDNGWTIADKVKRFTFNSQTSYNFSDKVSGSLIATGSVREQNAPGTVGRKSDPVYGRMTRDFDINPYSYALNTSRALTPYDDKGRLEYFTRNYAPFNIINELNNNKIRLSVVDVKLQAILGYKINKYLRYEFLGALRYARTTQEYLVHETSNKAQAYRAYINTVIADANRFLYKDPDQPNALPQVVLPAGGFYNRTENSLNNYNIRNQLTYTRSFGKHDLNILAGQELKSADRQNAYNNGYGYQYDYGGTTFINYLIVKKDVEQGTSYYGMEKLYDRFASFYSKADYTLNGKYNLTVNLRYDGSNQLGKSSTARWLPTWGVSGAWNMDQEEWLRNVSFLNYLKLRASYGLTASFGIATNSSIVLKQYNTRRQYFRDIESGIYIDDLENSDLTWEKNHTTNIGMETGLFDSRLTLVLDVYKRRGFDLIADIRTSGIGGQVNKVGNYADLKSQGIEVTLGGDIIRQQNWKWTSSLTFGYNKNKITNARNTPIIFDQVAAEGGNKNGYPVKSLFSLDFKGLEPGTGIPNFVNEKGGTSRGVYLQDIETRYLKYEGPVDPPINGGWSNTFRYKNLSLNILLTCQAGNKIRLTPVFKPTYSDLDALPREFLDRWTLAGDETRTNIPSLLDALTNYRIGSDYPYNNYNYSSARVADGGFLRLKYVSFTYLLPPAFITRTGLSNLSVTASASNLWLLYADKRLKGQDPEFFNTGGVAQPLQRQLAVSLKVGF
jgi:TonB-linked SusC/RagA family outer membrane protein